MLNRRGLIAVAVLGSTLAPAAIRAQDQAIVGIPTVTTHSADARITALAANARAHPPLPPGSGHFGRRPGRRHGLDRLRGPADVRAVGSQDADAAQSRRERG